MTGNKKIAALSLIILIFILGGLFGRFVTDSFFDNSKPRSQLVLTQLKKIQKLEVLQSTLFAHKVYSDDSLLGINDNEFVIIATGKAIYGIDFSKETSLKTDGKKVTVSIPRVELFDIILNPDNIEIIAAKKGLLTSQNRFEQIKKNNLSDLQSEIRIKARNREVLLKAQENAENIITSFFKAMGFEEVVINYGIRNDEL